MDLVCDVLDAVREFLGVWDKVPGRISACRPAVIHDDVVVAEILEAEGDNSFGSFQDDGLVHAAGERVPSVL